MARAPLRAQMSGVIQYPHTRIRRSTNMSSPPTPLRGNQPISFDSSPIQSPTSTMSDSPFYGRSRLVRIQYDCGDYERDGPTIESAQLRQCSKRARRELLGRTLWIVECQHYEQAAFFDELFAFFKSLPNPVMREDFVEVRYHPEIDPDNTWIPQLGWKDLLLLHHCIQYLHLREPLDNQKVRRQIWNRLGDLKTYPLEAADLHLAYQLLQFKGRWDVESAIEDDDMMDLQQSPNPGAARQFRSRLSSSTSATSASSSLNDEMKDMFRQWDEQNAALLRKMVREVARWLKDGGSEANFEKYVEELCAEARPCDEHGVEPNGSLVDALQTSYIWYRQRAGLPRVIDLLG